MLELAWHIRAYVRPRVAVTLTRDFGNLLSAMHGSRVEGTPHLSNALQVAQLALKHRENKLQRQRIICFVGSPVAEEASDLVRLARKMKKNNIAVDFVNFGELASGDESDQCEKTAKLTEFINAINSQENR